MRGIDLLRLRRTARPIVSQQAVAARMGWNVVVVQQFEQELFQFDEETASRLQEAVNVLVEEQNADDRPMAAGVGRRSGSAS